jgi:serine/threonine-protein kinase HipA
MPDVSVLNVLLYGERIGTLTFLQGEQTLFAFNDTYINNENRSTLSLSFKDGLGNLITELKPTRQRVPTFFANMLPEGEMREYLANRAGVNPKREFFLLWILGKDLPGAVTIEPADGEAWPPDVNSGEKEEEKKERKTNALRFSLAGVQLKFSALKNASGGLTIPAEGVGGSWIVKLPSTKFDDVPENEFSMMTLAAKIGMDVPEVQLIDPASISRLPDGIEALKGKALAVKRFDRTDGGPVHIEDFAQVFRLWPEEKYGRASYRNIAEVVAAETGNPGIAEFIRRLVFNTFIGNADMHAKNWSLIYPDRRQAAMAPAYDFVSTVPYIADDNSALSFGRTKRFDKFTRDELAYLAGKARLPEKLVLDTAGETVDLFLQTWNLEKKNLPLSKKIVDDIDAQVKKIPLARK